MKKIIFIILACMSLSSAVSQENTKTLTIVGESKKKIEIGSYNLTVSLKEIVTDGYQQHEPKSLSQVKQIYTDKLKAIGVDFNNFHKNFAYQFYSSYSETNDVAYFYFNSTSQEEIKKIIDIKMNGLNIVQVEIIAKEKTNEQLADLTHIAIEDAKIKASKIANNLHKKLGDIIKVENTSTREQYIDMYKPEQDQKHYATVTFTIE
ncbi:SIMPL domain-containing protein [Aquimarina muelleri]|uniref:SIMPL domain-containing protein n=1 Tax=Aquimarina muelleri TaxID=279356 RepID=UPI003F6890BD